METEYAVTGMTCDHCAAAVRAEVAAVTGVRAADVRLATGRLTVTGDGFDDEAVRAAVAEAGYAASPAR